MKQAKIRLFLVGFISILSASAAADDGATATFVIDTVRHQGMKCDRVLSLEKAVFESIPVESSWKLRCTNASYWVQIIPNVFTHIEKVDPADDLSTVGKSWLQ